MKKFTFILFATFVATMAWAQNEPITSVEGRAETYIRTGLCLYPQEYSEEWYIYEGSQGGAMTIVFGENKEVYFQDPVYGYKHGTYVKGMLSDDGKTITVPVPQPLFNDPQGNVVFGVGKFDDTSKEYKLDGSIKSITYSVEGDNMDILTLNITDKYAPVGDFWELDSAFAGRGEWETVLTRYVEVTETVEVTEEELQNEEVFETVNHPLGGAFWAKGAETYLDINEQIRVATKDDTVYVQGMVPMLPEEWVRGVKKNGVVTFPLQLITVKDGQKYFLSGLSGDGLNMAPFTMLFDEDLKSYAAQSKLVVNNSDLYYDESTVWGYYTGVYVGQRPEPVKLPEYIAENEIRQMPYEGVYDNGVRRMSTAGIVNVVNDGDDFYFQGLVKNLPDAWVKGTTDNTGSVIIIPEGQYVGYDAYGNVFAVGDKYYMKDFFVLGESSDDADSVRIAYDYEKPTFRLMSNFYASRKADDIDRSNLFRAGVIINEGELWIAKQQNYGNGEDVTEATVGDEADVTLYFDKADGSNAPKYYNSGSAVRLYAGNNLTVKADSKVMGKIAIQFWTGDPKKPEPKLACADGTFVITDSLGIWTGDANEVVFNVPNESGNQARIKSIMVFYFDYSSSVVDVPNDLETEPYQLTAKFESPMVIIPVDTVFDVNVGFRGNDVYFQGLSRCIPDAWVKGKLSEDGKVAIPNWYMGHYDPYGVEALAYDIQFGSAEFDYSAALNNFTIDRYSTINPTSMSDWDREPEVFTEVSITKREEVAATPQTPKVTGFDGISEERYVSIDIPLYATDKTGLYTKDLSYALFVRKGNLVEQLTFDKDVYTTLLDNMMEIPYSFTDDTYISHNTITLLQSDEELQSWNLIGVQSIYRGGGETKRSDIGWCNLAQYWADGIVTVNRQQEVGAVFFDLQGRQVDASAKGLFIKQIRLSDGTIKTVKIVRK